MFDERELKFEIGDGEGLGLPAGVEKAIMAMEQGEEALFTIKPKYVTCTLADLLYCGVTVNVHLSLLCNAVIIIGLHELLHVLLSHSYEQFYLIARLITEIN